MENMVIHSPFLSRQPTRNTFNLHRLRHDFKSPFGLPHTPHKISLPPPHYNRKSQPSQSPVHCSRERYPRSQNYSLRIRHPQVPWLTNLARESRGSHAKCCEWSLVGKRRSVCPYRMLCRQHCMSNL